MIRTTSRKRLASSLMTAVTATAVLGTVAVPGASARPADVTPGVPAAGAAPYVDMRSPDTKDAAQHRAIHVAPDVKPSSSDGFDWTDAAIGAGGALGVVLLGGGAAVQLTRRRQRPAITGTGVAG
ncbi:MAG: hypothetical protein QOH43_282 [Solirubrobacteraceae bacterium]|jgi:hypothetical protein|nr:hypothetical protein [Solirubrobacteraceae bacterium]